MQQGRRKPPVEGRRTETCGVGLQRLSLLASASGAKLGGTVAAAVVAVVVMVALLLLLVVLVVVVRVVAVMVLGLLAWQVVPGRGGG